MHRNRSSFYPIFSLLKKLKRHRTVDVKKAFVKRTKKVDLYEIVKFV